MHTVMKTFIRHRDVETKSVPRNSQQAAYTNNVIVVTTTVIVQILVTHVCVYEFRCSFELLCLGLAS